MQMVIERDGTVRCLYSEEHELHLLGGQSIARGSHVEPSSEGRWTAGLSPVNGPVPGPYRHRSDALAAERQGLEEHWLPAAR